MKTCNCGKEHKEIPESAKWVRNDDVCDGAWWDCSCKSTLFLPVTKMNEDQLETMKTKGQRI